MITSPFRSLCRRHALRAAGAVVSLLLLNQTASAVDGTWAADTSGTWSTPANWLNNTVADGSGFTANFGNVDITADRTVTLDSARTIGNLIFGDTATATSFNWILSNGGTAGNVLTLQTAAGSVPTISTNTLTGKSAFIQLVLAGTQGMTKLGANTLNLQGINTYTGTTLVDAGTLTLSNAVSSANTTGSLASTQITVRGALVLDNSLYSGSTVDRISDSATLTLTGGPNGNNAYTLAINPGSATTVTETVGALSFSNGYSAVTMTAAGAEVGASARSGRLNAGSVSRVGGATVRIAAVNLGSNSPTSGSTGVQSGRLTFTDASGLGMIGTTTASGGPGTVTNLKVIPWMFAESGGTAATETNLRGNSLVTYDASNGVRVLAPAETATFANIGATTDTNVRETVTGGTVATPVNSVVTLTGNTVVNSLQLVNSNTVNSSGNLTLDLGGFIARVASGAVLAYNTTNNTVTIQNGTLTAGTAANTNGELILQSGGNGGTTTPSSLVIANNGTGITSVTLGGTKTFTLAGNNTFTGALNVSLSNGLFNTATLSGSDLFTSLNAYSGTVVPGTTSFNGVPVVAVNRGAMVLLPDLFSGATGTTTIQGLNDIDGGGVVANANGGGTSPITTRTLILSGTGTYAYSGLIQNQATVGNAGTVMALSKTGSGTQTLSGANTYTGATSVTAGTLLFNGNSSAATGAVTVGASGTLGGTGSIGGATTVNGTLLVGANTGAGSTPGLLTFTNTGAALALAGTSLFDINGAGTRGAAFDAVNVTGALTYGGVLNISLNGFTPADGSQFDLFDFASRTGTTTFSAINVVDNGAYSTSFDYATGIVTFSVTAVPEPSTLGTAAVGLLLFAGYCLRRRRRVA